MELRINVEWLEPIGEPTEQAVLVVDCTDGVRQTLTFEPGGESPQIVVSDGACTLTDRSFSDVELVSENCAEIVDVSQADAECDFAALGMYVGVPTIGFFGGMALIVGVLAIAWTKLRP